MPYAAKEVSKTKFSPSHPEKARPFLKWAGGKSQILHELESRLPSEIRSSGNIDIYIEPFIGGGAFFFQLKNKFSIQKSFLFDINPVLITAYRTVQREPENLISKLSKIQNHYIPLKRKKREEYFYSVRKSFNRDIIHKNNSDNVSLAARLIFLNKTCFNGLFRQNSLGKFNVPFGDYKNPKICDGKNIIACSLALKNTRIFLGDFKRSEKYIRKDTLVYMDPPYRPISATSSFTAYAKGGFSDKDQARLAEFFGRNSKIGAYLMLSNSDPKNRNSDDNYFDHLYARFSIDRVFASRHINSKGRNRGAIKELVIRNF